MTRDSEIEARVEAATPGPWKAAAYGDIFADRGGIVAKTYLDGDDDFIAHVREDIPYLLAELKEAREKLAAVEAWYEKWDGGEPNWYELDCILHPKEMDEEAAKLYVEDAIQQHEFRHPEEGK